MPKNEHDKNEETGAVSERMLVEKRYAIYEAAAGGIAAIEDAARKRDYAGAREKFDKLRADVRLSMAFLSREVVSRVEEMRAFLYENEKPGKDKAARFYAMLLEKTVLLHAAAARLLADTRMHTPEEVLGIVPLYEPPAKEKKPAKPAPPPAPVKKMPPPPKKVKKTAPSKKELEQDYEDRALQAMNAKKYRRAAKYYRKLLDLHPDRASMHNDLGLSYRLSGDTARAVEHYRKAVELNDASPDKRSAEYYNVFYNLGMALKARALDRFTARKVKDSLDSFYEAVVAFERYCDTSPDKGRKRSATGQIARIRKDITSLEKMWRIISRGERKIDFDKVRIKMRESRKIKSASVEKIESETTPDEESILSETVEDVIREEET
jgi:tetratricopeptide (TPR) repeat protein